MYSVISFALAILFGLIGIAILCVLPGNLLRLIESAERYTLATVVGEGTTYLFLMIVAFFLLKKAANLLRGGRTK